MTSLDFVQLPPPPSLEEALDTFGDEANDDRGAFVVDSETKAIWAARKLKAAREEIVERNAVADRQVEQIESWLLDANSGAARDVEFFEGLLTAYHRDVFTTDEKKKSIKLPDAELVSRKQPDKWEVDDDKFVEWAKKTAPTLVRSKEEPALADAKKVLKLHVNDDKSISVVEPETGAYVDGVTVTPGERKFTVKT